MQSTISQSSSSASSTLKQSRDSIIKLQDYVGRDVRVKFQGGREITGTLKSCDNSLNIIMDNCLETIRDAKDPYIMTEQKRKLGLVVVRGSLVSAIFPMCGAEMIENPFANITEEE